jgi:Fe-S-cluster containining protein
MLEDPGGGAAGRGPPAATLPAMQAAISADEAQRRLRALHDQVDVRAARLARRHAGRLRCGRGCSACCRDDLTVFEVEAERIRRAHPELLAVGTPHAAGACAFLGAAGDCRVYAERPYVCRTQGLPLRWLEEEEPGRVVERRDICPLNEAGPPLETLDPRECWTLGEVEGQLAALQAARGGGALRRVALRSLFRAQAPGDASRP